MSKNTKRDSMVFFASYYEAMKELKPEEFKTLMSTIIEYGIFGNKPHDLDPVCNMAFMLIKPTIDHANTRYQTAVENGKKGGAPLGNTNRKKKTAASENGSDLTEIKPHSTEIQAPSSKNNLTYTYTDTSTDTSTDTESYTDTETFSESDALSQSENEYISGETPAKAGDITQKSAFGEYKNVFLTISEKARLIVELGYLGYDDSLAYLSRYIKRKPEYRSASHFEDMRGWVRNAIKNNGFTDERREQEKLERMKKEGFDIDFEDIYERF